MPGGREGAALSINLVSSPLPPGHETTLSLSLSMSWRAGCLEIFLRKSCLVLKLFVFRGTVKVFLLISSYFDKEDQLR